MSDRFFAATRKGLFTVRRAGGAWKIAKADFLADNLPMVLHDPRDDTLYAAIAHGHFGSKLQRSSDGGATWQEIPAPAYPEPPKDAEPDKCPMRGIPIPWKVELIWSLETGGRDQPGWIWCGTIPGGLFLSKDRGDSWTLVRSLWDHPSRRKWFGGGMDYPGIHSICVDPRDSRHVRVGISCGGVWGTTDAGQSWTCQASGMRAAYMPPEQGGDPEIQDPHRLVQCRARPDALWAQHHNGIFRTTDSAASWHEIMEVKPSSFGFGVAVHPATPDTAWFAPAIKDEKRIPADGRVVVTRTTDGGKSFETLHRGLPQSYAYDIIFRHCLEVDETGDNLIMGSTTGSLWASSNGGDSWDEISSHLPPIYCLRFA